MGSAFGTIWEDPEGGFIKFTVKRALKQDQTLHMEGKLHVILYFREEDLALVIQLFSYFRKQVVNTIFCCSQNFGTTPFLYLLIR